MYLLPQYDMMLDIEFRESKLLEGYIDVINFLRNIKYFSVDQTCRSASKCDQSLSKVDNFWRKLSNQHLEVYFTMKY